MRPDFNYKPVDYDPFQFTALEKTISPIPSQREIWLACQIGGEEANKSYIESVSLKLKGAFSASLFMKALAALVERHEALRATFGKDGKLIFIQENLVPEVYSEDLSGFGQHEQESRIADFLTKNADTSFDLENGPLFRLAIHKFSEALHLFTLSIHHIIGDGWSLGVLLEEICTLYNGYISPGKAPLEKADSLGDYCQQIHTREGSSEQFQTEQFWLDQFKDVSGEFSLPTDFPRPEIKSYKSSRLDFSIPNSQIDKIKQFGRKENVSLVNVFITAFELYLAKKYRSDEVVLGIPAAGQAAMGCFNLVGHCVNLLPLRSRLSPEDTFLQHLKKRNDHILDCYDHQLFTYSSLLNKLNIKRDLSKSTLVPIIFNLDMGMDANVRFENLDYELISNPKAYDNFEIALNLTNSKDHFRFDWSYNTTLFSKETIETMMEEFSRILDMVVGSPQILLSEIKLHDEGKVVDFYHRWNQTEMVFPQKDSIAQILHETATRYAQRTAVEFHQQKLSYGELEKLSNQLAAFIHASGIQKGESVGLFLPRSADLIVALIGIIKSGAVYIPIDPGLPKDRIKHMLEDSEAKAIITASDLQDEIPSGVNVLVMEAFLENAEDYPEVYMDRGIRPDDPLYLLYTSGSTGLPKGVQVSHQNLVNIYYSAKNLLNLGENDRTLAITTISFDVAGMEIFGTLGSGATLVMADAITQKDGRILLKALKERHITRVFSTPATYQMLLHVGWTEYLPVKIVSGGEPFHQNLIEQLLPLTDEIWNAYGPTETTIFSTIKRIDRPREFDSIGAPIHNTCIYLLDEQGQLMPQGDTGEIYIGGKGLALGYWNRPDLNRERFVQVRLGNENIRLYKTGDLGKIKPNGELMCLGRMDTQVKIRGYRIELGEIEQQINLIEELNASHVTTFTTRSGTKSLVAYVIRKNLSSSVPTEEEIDAWKQALTLSLPDYMIPTEWISLDHFPLTPNGKIDQKSLPVPAAKASVSTETDTSKWTQSQRLVGEIWKKCLNLSFVQLDDDFFQLGGHSIMAVEVMSKLDQETGKQLPLTTLFKFPTIRKFALAMDDSSTQESMKKEWSSLVPIKPSGSKPPIYLVHGVAANITNYYKLIDHVDPDQPLYGLQAKGLNGIDTPNEGLENIAAHYVNEIIEHNPNGPYHIGGYSFGGYVAYEMAQQLIKMGKNMGQLIIFDTSVEIQQEASHASLVSKIKKELAKRQTEWQLLVNAPSTFRTTKARMIKRKAEDLLEKIGLVKEEEMPKDRASIIKKIKQINNKAIETYIVKPIDYDITLFKARIKLAPVMEEVYYGWAPFVNQVRVIDVEGDHNSMFEIPFIVPFAHKLQKLLNEVPAMQKTDT